MRWETDADRVVLIAETPEDEELLQRLGAVLPDRATSEYEDGGWEWLDLRPQQALAMLLFL